MKTGLFLVYLLLISILLIFNSAFALADECPLTGMIGYWKLDEGSGTTVADSANGNDGTVSGATWIEGRVNSALNFDGSNDYVDCGNDESLDIRNELTIEAWINPDTTKPAHGYHSAIVDHGNSYWFLILDTGELAFLRFKGGSFDAIATTNEIIPIGTWTHVVATYDYTVEDEVNLYIDGVLRTTGDLDGPIDSSTSPLLIGNRGGLHHFDGKIDEVSVYNRALSAEEISGHYNLNNHYCGADEVTVKLLDSNGDGIEGEEVEYCVDEEEEDCEWEEFGETDENGEVKMLLSPGEYKFKISYEDTSQEKEQDTNIDSTIIFQTTKVTVKFLDSENIPMEGEEFEYCVDEEEDCEWEEFGETDENGETSKELLPLSYNFRIEYEDVSQEKTQDVSVDPVIIFQTTKVTVKFLDSESNAIVGEEAKYCYAEEEEEDCGWEDFETTDENGETTKELLPLNYKFMMIYERASQEKEQDTNIDSTIIFQTTKAIVKLLDLNGDGIKGGAVQYSVDDWKEFGITDLNGEASKELLPLEYNFKMTYKEESQEKTQDIDMPIEFTTTKSNMIVYVDKATGDDNNIGNNPSNPKETIQGGVEQAAETGTVNVAAETYNECIAIDESMNLIGEDKETTIIDGTECQRAVEIKSDNVLIKGFTVENAFNGIYISDSKSVTIEDNKITNNNNGIYIDLESENILVKNNEITGNTDYGILTEGTLVDAKHNLWGHELGPYHETSNPEGQGDRISDNVEYSPWFTNNEKEEITTTIINNQTMDSENVTVEIPENIRITGPAEWDGTVNAPTVQETAIDLPEEEPGATLEVGQIIEIGYSEFKLTFDKAVRIVILGDAGKLVGHIRTGEPFTEITAVCGEDSQTWADANIADEGDCKISVDNDLVVWTKHFTQFITYTQTQPSSSVSSGFGSSSSKKWVETTPIISPVTTEEAPAEESGVEERAEEASAEEGGEEETNMQEGYSKESQELQDSPTGTAIVWSKMRGGNRLFLFLLIVSLIILLIAGKRSRFHIKTYRRIRQKIIRNNLE